MDNKEKDSNDKETYEFKFQLSREALHNLLMYSRTYNMTKNEAINNILTKVNLVPLALSGERLEPYLKMQEKLEEEVEKIIDSYNK